MSDQAPPEDTKTAEPTALGQAMAARAPESETPEAQSPAWMAKLTELGFENVKDPDEAIDRLVAHTRQLKDEFGSQLQQALEQLKSQPTTQPQVHDAQDGNWWNPPKVDTALISKYRNQDGSWMPETPTDLRQQVEAAQAYYDRWAHDLVQRPHEVLPKLIRQEAERLLEEKLAQTQQTQKLTQFQQQVFSENTWLFEQNPVTGKPNTNALSAEGKLIDAYMQEAQQRGADYELAWEHAFNKHQAAKAAAQAKNATTAQSAAEINEQKKRELLNRAAPTANRTGSMPAPSENRASQRNQQLRPGQRALQIAQRTGVAIN